MMIEIAWSWLRYQPQSKLSKWFWERFGKGSARQRRVGIVAARQVALPEFVELKLRAGERHQHDETGEIREKTDDHNSTSVTVTMRRREGSTLRSWGSRRVN